jgi:glycosyltransferase involved in cell wall biosynthesis
MNAAVVIPLHRQAQFLVDSVMSALTQTLSTTTIVIVNDGCPDPASHQLGTAFAAAYPDRIAYVRQRNGGLSAARNCGVRHALRRWPYIDALFFLDADNLIEPHTLEAMYTLMGRVGGPDWVYAALERFGADDAAWHPHTPANLFRMLFDNQCDAGSLVARRIFDAGIYFDETMREGYEDWEFFLRALRHGYRGESAGSCGLRYRVKQQSMLTECQAKHDLLVAEVHDRHRELLEPRRLTAVEHAHCPRFLWTEPDGSFSAFTDPYVESETAAAEEGKQDRYWPPVLIVGTSEVRRLLADAKMLRGLLLAAQAESPRGIVSFRIATDGRKWELARESGAPHLLCLFSEHIRRVPKRGAEYRALARAASRLLRAHHQLAVRLPSDHISILPEPLDAADVHNALLHALERGVFDPSRQASPDTIRQWHLRQFAWERHCVDLETTYPLARDDKLHIAIAAPWLKLGGLDQCVVQVSRAIRRLAPNAVLHLVITRDGIESGFDKAQAFDEVLFLGILDDWERRTRVCDVVFRSMDLVINAHSEVAYESLRWRVKRSKPDRQGVHVSYLHVIDEDRGQLAGYPVTATNIEHALDGFAVISENLRSFLVNNGVSPGKIRVLRNAPVVRPRSIEDAVEMAAAKARRLAAGDRPLRLLFAGRADYQKGMSRLKSLVEILAARSAPFALTFVGEANLDGESLQWPLDCVRLRPPTHDEAALSRYYAEADVCVLLSRWEGVPLSLLDAMAHGCVVVATDVGAISEVVDNGRTGYLVSNDRDEEVARHAADLIERIIGDNTGSLDVRRQAVAAAWQFSWDAAAQTLLSFLPGTAIAKHGLSEVIHGPV